ncbi:MAG TPA: histidinol dehydrogenase [Candidatus Dormibacteraeota bacterium]|jgi:histidinol dehydrogenase|nr:histidinol dehydrogenase [Candidatus Dormibacteraeota bacterium]
MRVPVFTVAEWAASGMSRRRFEVPTLPPAVLARVAEALAQPVTADWVGLDVTAAVRLIVQAVRDGGDAALRRLTLAFDGVDLASIEVGPEARREGAARVAPEDRAAIDLAAKRIEAFHALQAPSPIVTAEIELRPLPLRRAGIYIPGGHARYPSTVLMNAIPARIAGVAEVVMVTPPGPDGAVPPAVLYAAEVAGVHRVFAIGGAQAVAALAYGTESIPAVDKITGPGNVFVTLAKREVFGAVDIDGLAGPTEIMVVADESADERQVVVDLASQLEHDPLAWAVLVTDSEPLARRVAAALGEDDLANRFTAGLGAPADPRSVGSEAGEALHAAVVVAPDVATAVEVANDFAPEHLELLVRDVEEHLPQVRAAGMVFTGAHSPVPMGDYVAGSNHTLPTGGAARYASPLGVYDFYRWTTVVNLSAATAREIAPAAIMLSRLEGLPAHERSLRHLLTRLEEN